MLVRLLLVAGLLAPFGLVPAAAFAQKVGVVDVQKVMEGIPAWGKAVESLRRDFEKKKADLEARQGELKKVKDQIDAKRTVSDPRTIRAEEEKFMQTAQAFQAEFMKAQQEISEREAGLKDTVLARIERVVQELATEGEYDFVFEAGATNAPNVLFAKKSVMVTDQVVALYKKAFGDQAITVAPKPKAPTPPEVMAARTIAEVAALVGGDVVHGSGAGVVTRVMPIDGASADAISFITKPKYLPHLSTTLAGAVMISAKLLEGAATGAAALIVVEHPYAAFAKAAQLFAPPVPAPRGVHSSAAIAPGASIGRDVSIGPFVLIGAGATIGAGAVLHAGAHVHEGASVGEGTVLYDHVVIRHGCTVGARCILHPGVVIGADGFGFAQEGEVHLKIPQTGTVAIEDDVEIGANACVDRAALGVTRVRAGTKIDNLVQIGHNADIGEGCLLVAQSGVAGSSRLGARVTLGAQSGISGHVQVGEGVTVFGQAGVMNDVEPHQKMAGTPATPAAEFFRTVVRLTKLDELTRKLRAIEKIVGKG